MKNKSLFTAARLGQLEHPSERDYFVLFFSFKIKNSKNPIKEISCEKYQVR